MPKLVILTTKLKEERDYWLAKLSGEQGAANLPLDFGRSKVYSRKRETVEFTIGGELYRQLVNLVSDSSFLIYTALMTAMKVCLHKYVGSSRIAVGSPALRGDNGAAPQTNALVIVDEIDGKQSFRELLVKVRQTLSEAYARQSYPFQSLLSDLELEKVNNHCPLFDVALALKDMHGDLPELKHDITATFIKGADGLSGVVEFNARLFQHESVERFTKHFLTVLSEGLDNDHAPISDLNFLTGEEREQLLVKWNDTQLDLTRGCSLRSLFEAQVARVPDAIALTFAGEHLTYRELNRRANQLAHRLQKLGVGPDVLVGVLLERSLEMLVAVLGIVKAGGAYVPLDPSYPDERLSFMMRDAAVPILLTQAQLAPGLASAGSQIICLDGDAETLASESEANPAGNMLADTLCYVLYTSGSTGQPKGVAMSHSPLANLICWQLERSAPAGETRTLQFAPLSFDVSFQEIFSTWCSGNTLVLIPEQARRDPTELWLLMTKESVERLFVPFVALQQLAEVSDGQSPAPPGLRQIITAGEQPRVTPPVVALFRKLPNCTLDNQYGPTEAHVVSSFLLDQTPGRWPSLPPIGRPISNAQIFLLDARQHPVPVGVAGELHIGGDALARGYLNQPDLTAERFIPHPFSSEPGRRLYRTRDLARYLPAGDIEFLGRVDHQVKIRGFRVEPGEVEVVLGGHPAVREVVVMAREDEPGRKRLVAYLVTQPGRVPETAEWRNYLKEKLPEHMVPSAFVVLDALPLTPSGKVDSGKLPEPGQTRTESALEVAGPRTATEELLTRIWADILRIDQVGIYDNFFELGGDSILTIQVVARATQAGVRIIPKQLFQHQTIAGLASVAGASPTIEAEQGPVVGPLPLLPIQHWFFELQSPEPHHFNMGYLFEVEQSLDAALLEQSVRALLVHHDALRLRFQPTHSGWQQFNADVEEAVPFERIDLAGLPAAEQEAAALSEAARLHVSLNLSAGPLLRVVLFDIGAQRARLLFIIHHLAVDGVSWRILLEDLQTAYRQLESGETIRLPRKTTSFKRWAECMAEHAQTQSVRQELDYWLAAPRKWVDPLPVDNPEGANTEQFSETVVLTLEPEETISLLRETLKNSRVRINDVLLTALARAFARWTSSHRLLVDVEGHGREEIVEGVDLTRTVGWFTSICPMLLETSEHELPGEALHSIKEQIHQLPNRGLGYGLLRYLSLDPATRESLQALPRAEVSFNYLGQFDQLFNETAMFSPARLSTGQIASPHGARPHLLYVNGFVYQNQLYMKFTYSTDVYRRTTVADLGQSFMQELRALITHCQFAEVYVPSDFPLSQVTQAELEEVFARVEFEGEEVR